MEQERKDRKKLIIIIAAALVLVTIVSVLVFGGKKEKTEPETEDDQKEEYEEKDDGKEDSGPEIIEEDDSDKKDEEETETETKKVTESVSSIVIPGYTELVLPSGKKHADTELVNPEENGKNYEMSFSLRIKETGEVLFTTDYVSAGEAVTEVELSAYLVSGTYDAIMTIQPRRKDGTLTNNVEMEILLIVE